MANNSYSDPMQGGLPPKFCPSCGTPNPGTAKFCSRCGFNFQTIAGGQAGQQRGVPQQNSPRQNSTQQNVPSQNSAQQNVPHQNAPRPLPNTPKPAKKVPVALFALIPVLLIAAAVLVFLLLHGRKTGEQETAAQTTDASVSENIAPSDGGPTSAPENAENTAAAGEENTDPPKQVEIPGTAEIVVEDASGTTTTVHVEALPRPIFMAVNAKTTASGNISPAVNSYTVSPDLSNIVNLDRMYLSNNAKNLLAQNGFYVAARSGGDEFYETYEMNRYSQRPSFVTTDSMMHTYHLYFSHLMKNTERNYLSASLTDTAKLMLSKSAAQLEALKGTEWEMSAKINTAFFGVGAALLDPSVQIPADVQDLVNSELSLISAASGISPSPIMNCYGPQNEQYEDYSQYIVRGYYEGDAQLEKYFRAMMWFGRMNFMQSDETLDRSALLMTLALDQETLPKWESIYAVTSFFAGASDDSGYYEYRPIIDTAYGAETTVSDLPGNTDSWAIYHALTGAMAPPKINSVAVVDDQSGEDRASQNKGYRFMGQRFSIDAVIFQNLLYNKVGSNSSGANRMLPDALDIPAALGSDSALSILQSRGATDYAGYSENMTALREEIKNAPEELWTASLYSKWLDTLRPMLEVKGAGYPAFMQTDLWTRKNLQSFLGSYAELKHDTVLYSKQVMVEMGGDDFGTYDDRGYVEPEPEVFGRLAALTQATINGLSSYGLLGQEDADNLALLAQLADQLRVIAEKELRNELPTDAEFDLIRTYGGQLEHFWREVYKNETDRTSFRGRDFPAAVITDVATDPNGSVLEIGTGHCGNIYVVVPVDGTLRIATGSVYSFYQFSQPLSDRLTDSKWRVMMGVEMNDAGTYNEPAKELEDWTKDFQKTWQELQ